MSICRRATILGLLFLIGLSLPAHAQTPYAYFDVLGGLEIREPASSPRDAQFSVVAGITLKHPAIGFEVEGGYLGRSSSSHGKSGLFSVNYRPVFYLSNRMIPFATAGYTRLNVGNALNFGAGLDYFPDDYGWFGLRVELRDYIIQNESSHRPILRGGIVFGARFYP